MTKVYIDGVRYVPQKPALIKKTTELHELIFSARERLNETLEDAAESIGTTKSHLWTIENGGAMPRLPMLQKILRHFDIDFYEIALEETE